MFHGKVICGTCNDQSLQKVSCDNKFEFLIKCELGILANHVYSPHCSSHKLKVDSEDFLESSKLNLPLKIECLNKKCVENSENIFECECSPFEVGLESMTFHAAHEAHNMKIEYGNDENKWMLML